jgi:hypothetical protein
MRAQVPPRRWQSRRCSAPFRSLEPKPAAGFQVRNKLPRRAHLVKYSVTGCCSFQAAGCVEGFEPSTHRLQVCCSTQLSYSQWWCDGTRTRSCGFKTAALTLELHSIPNVLFRPQHALAQRVRAGQAHELGTAFGSDGVIREAGVYGGEGGDARGIVSGGCGWVRRVVFLQHPFLMLPRF